MGPHNAAFSIKKSDLSGFLLSLSDTAMEEEPVFGLFPNNGEINNMLEQVKN